MALKSAVKGDEVVTHQTPWIPWWPPAAGPVPMRLSLPLRQEGKRGVSLVRRPQISWPGSPYPGSPAWTHLRWAPGAPCLAARNRTRISSCPNSCKRLTANPAGSIASECQRRCQRQERRSPQRDGGLLSIAALADWRGISAGETACQFYTLDRNIIRNFWNTFYILRCVYSQGHTEPSQHSKEKPTNSLALSFVLLYEETFSFPPFEYTLRKKQVFTTWVKSTQKPKRPELSKRVVRKFSNAYTFSPSFPLTVSHAWLESFLAHTATVLKASYSHIYYIFTFYWF